MPETEEVNWVKLGDFGDTNLEEIRAFAQQAERNNTVFVKGRFHDTLPIPLRALPGR